MSEFKNKIIEFSNRIDSVKSNLKSEEATKTALVLPFIQQILNYDIFNPLEVVPELTADVGIKKGEKVDYAILKDNKPIVIIEVKPVYEELSIQHTNQLYRYYTSIDEVKFAILTNGVKYKFFTELQKKNIMDQEPFLEIDLSKLTEDDINELYSFTKDVFDEEEIINNYKTRNYKNILFNKIKSELDNPSDEFIKFLMKDCGISIRGNELKKLRKITNECLKEVLKKDSPDTTNTVVINQEEVLEVTEPTKTILTLNDKFKFCKPKYLMIENTSTIEVYSWRNILVELCTYLGRDDLEKFARLEEELKGKKRKLISKNKWELREAVYVQELDIYLEVNLSADYIVNVLKKILTYYGRDIDSIKIEVEM